MTKKESTKQAKTPGGSPVEDKRTSPKRTPEGFPQAGRRGGWEEHAGSVRSQEFVPPSARAESPRSAESRERGGLAKDGRSANGFELTGRIELTDEEADQLVTQALDCELPEPEPFVRILVFLSDLNDQGRAPELSASLHRLIT
ncbi:MAG: hypothetical protein ACREAC_12965, partial [Blastocatellia bacterium]